MRAGGSWSKVFPFPFLLSLLESKTGAGFWSAASQISKTPFSQVIRCNFITRQCLLAKALFSKGCDLDLHQVSSLTTKHHFHFSLTTRIPNKLPNSWRKKCTETQKDWVAPSLKLPV